jgi:hypothetical protein
MTAIIGSVPVYADDDGQVFVDPADLEGEDEESGALWPFGRQARRSP